VRIDIRIPVGRPLPELGEIAQRCEAGGFHGIGIHDHHHTGRDVFMALGQAAARTTRLHLYPATSNAVTRHPMVLAALTHSLAELAPGRVMLTLAPGYLSVERAGTQHARREQLREVVTAVREMLAGGRNMAAAAPGAPEVLVLASGPKLLELAGEVADGAVMLVGLHPAGVAAARERLAAGARRAGRDPAGLHEVLIVPIAVGEDAREWPRRDFRPGQPWMHYPSRSNLRWLAQAGIDAGRDDPGRICDAFGLFGPPEHCAERLLRARDEIGLDHAFLFPAHTLETGYDIPDDVIDAFGRTIGPRL
jgi:5,10-methylenetetrahydromethanopterin reductase